MVYSIASHLRQVRSSRTLTGGNTTTSKYITVCPTDAATSSGNSSSSSSTATAADSGSTGSSSNDSADEEATVSSCVTSNTHHSNQSSLPVSPKQDSEPGFNESVLALASNATPSSPADHENAISTLHDLRKKQVRVELIEPHYLACDHLRLVYWLILEDYVARTLIFTVTYTSTRRSKNYSRFKSDIGSS